MKFWSNVEKEYNDFFGEKDERQDENGNEFNSMLSDIKKDLKNVPKDDLLPGLRPEKEDSDSEDEDGEFDVEDAKKTFKIRESKKKKGKKCKIGDKHYDVGERWKDPKTGKDMICILMNIPKEVQPKLEEADVTVTKDEVQPEPKDEDPDKKPETGPQWAYTNKTAKARGCPSDKEGEKPDQVGSEADLGDETKSRGEEDSADKETEDIDIDHSQAERNASSPGEEAETRTETEPTEKDTDTRENGGKETDDGLDVKPLENEAKTESLDANENEDESESATDSEEERRQAEKANRDEEDSEYEEKEEDIRQKNYDLNTTREDREVAVVQPDESEKQTKDDVPEDKVETDEKPQDAREGSLETTTATEEDTAKQEKGKTIYTKETTVTQRKLLKTTETIESVETEKNIK